MVRKIVVLLAAVVVMTCGGSTVRAEQIKLLFNVWIPPTSWFQTENYIPWAEKIEEVTGGRVKVEFTSSSLGPPNRQLDLVRTGVSDLGFGAHGYTPGVFPLTGVAELPFLSENGESLAVALWRVMQTYPAIAAEAKGVKILNVWGHTGVILLQRSKEPIKTVEEFKGLKIRVAAPAISALVERLGAAPVAAPASGTQELLARGVVDAAFWTFDSWGSFNLEGIVNSVTIVPGHFGNGTVYTMVNPKSWDRISKEDQDAIMKCCAGEISSAAMGATWDRVGARVKENMIKAGVTFHTLSSAETAKLRDIAGFIQEDWINVANEKGVDGQAVIDMLVAEQREYLKSKD